MQKNSTKTCPHLSFDVHKCFSKRSANWWENSKNFFLYTLDVRKLLKYVVFQCVTNYIWRERQKVGQYENKRLEFRMLS